MRLTTDDDIRTFTQLTLYPTVCEIDAQDGRRPYAAFQVALQFNMRGGDSTLIGDIYTCLQSALVSIEKGNSFPDDPSGSKQLALCGIPPTFASSFDDLRAFIGPVGRAEIYEVAFKEGSMIHFRDKAATNGSPISTTLRYGYMRLKRRVEGNYRELIAVFSREEKDIASFALHTERGHFSIAVNPQEDGMEFNNASFTLEFTIVDQRHVVKGATA